MTALHRHAAAAVAISAIAGAILVASASAGAPKEQTIASVEATARRQVTATMVVGSDRFDVVLAQITTGATLRRGPSCRATPTSPALTAQARRMHLTGAAQLVGTGASSYVVAPQDTGAPQVPQQTLNLALVSSGLATVNRERGRYRSTFLDEQRKAKRANRGLWACR